MNKEEAQKVLEELYEVRPELLNDKAKRLFEAIMKIADERDKAYKIIDKMANHIYKGCDFDNRMKTKEQILEYFKKVVDEDVKD